MPNLKYRNLGGFALASRPDAMDEVVYMAVELNVESLDSKVGKFIERARALRESGDFKPEGLQKHLAKLGAEADEAMNAFRPEDGYQAQVADAEKAMQKPPTARSEAAVLREYLEHREIRDHVAAMKDPIDRDTYYRQAVKDGNDLRADALERDVTGRIEFVDKDLVPKLRLERLAKNNPEAAAKWHTNTRAITEVKSAKAFARKALKEAGLLLPSTDPQPTHVGSSNAPARQTKGDGLRLPS